jgi:hypothetical protein
VIEQPNSGTRLSSNINSGWTRQGGAYWETIGDMIIGRQNNLNGGELVSAQSFGNFEIVFDAWPDFSVDTGLYVRSSADGQEAYQITIDYQPGNPMGGIWIVKPDYDPTDQAHWDFEIEDKQNIQAATWPNSLTGNTPAHFDMNQWSYIWKEDDWNQFRVRVEGNSPVKITTWINGWKVSEFTDDTNNRFPATGRIALQIHNGADNYDWEPGAVARFRNIKVYPIN